MRLSLFALLCLACSLIYCTGLPPTGELGRSTPATASPSDSEVDLGGRTAHAPIAFRQEGSSLVAYGDRFVAHVNDDGVRLETHDEQNHVNWKIGPSTIARGTGQSALPRKTELADGAVRLLHDDAVEERWENRGDALEQTWHFQALPRGEGDLVIRVRATGLDCMAETATGLHFGGGGLGFRYSDATWVDTAGRRTPVNVGWRDDHITLTVPRAVLENSTYPAVLDPMLSPEIGVDQSIPVQAFFQNGSTKVVASDSGFLVVWHTEDIGARGEIRAVRVGLDGKQLDPLPIVVGSAPNVTAALAVAGDGTDSFVTWTACQSGGGTCDVKSARVRSSDGAVLDALTVASGTGARTLAAARHGTTYFVGWSTYTEVRGSLVQNGAVIAGGTTGRLYATLPGFTGAEVAAASGTSNFMVAWGHSGLRLNPTDGTPLDAAPVAFAGIDAQTGFLQPAFCL